MFHQKLDLGFKLTYDIFLVHLYVQQIWNKLRNMASGTL